MDETPFYRRPWSYIIGWLIFLLIVYGWQIYRIGGIRASLVDIIIDLVIVLPIFFTWMAFFAQFVLPVRTFEERQKIFDRLLTHLFGGHGPAMFIRNGVIIKREGEEKTKGPGVVWLDSASAAVTRTAVKIKQTMGPGVHFLDRGEFIAGTIDLHIQSHSLGPKELDNPLDPKSDDQSDEEYKQVQDRCKQVTALTRDGIEIVPTISVTFRVDTGFPKDGQPGSRFGYRTSYTKKDKANEEKDKEAIRNAILGESIKYNVSSDSPRHRVAWNQLPTLLAVDVWREYVGKFTLDELFRPDQVVPPSSPQTPQPTEEEVDPLSQPLYVGPHRENVQSIMTGMLRQINLLISRLVKSLEGKKETRSTPPAPGAPTSPPAAPASPQMKTALQVITDMVKARLTQPEVDILDDNGRRGEGSVYSPEYELLKNRGLKILSVGISNLRFHPKIEAELINYWESTWLKNAKTEREQIERRRSILETAGEEKAARGYATALARGLMKEKPTDRPGTLKSLLMRSRLSIIKSEQLRRLMSTERQEIEEILQWMESDE